jgi:hypothetical protein
MPDGPRASPTPAVINLHQTMTDTLDNGRHLIVYLLQHVDHTALPQVRSPTTHHTLFLHLATPVVTPQSWWAFLCENILCRGSGSSSLQPEDEEPHGAVSIPRENA